MNTKVLILSIYAHVPLLSCVELLSFHITHLHCGYNVSAALIYWFTDLNWNRFVKPCMWNGRHRCHLLIQSFLFLLLKWRLHYGKLYPRKNYGSWTVLFVQINALYNSMTQICFMPNKIVFFFSNASCVVGKQVEPGGERQKEPVLLKYKAPSTHKLKDIWIKSLASQCSLHILRCYMTSASDKQIQYRFLSCIRNSNQD